MAENPEKKAFLARAVNLQSNAAEKESIASEIQDWVAKRTFALTWFDKYELAKSRAAYLRYKAIENLDKNLAEFEFHLNDSNIQVHWATDYKSAMQQIKAVSNSANSTLRYLPDEMVHELLQGEPLPPAEPDSGGGHYIVCGASFVVSDSSSIVLTTDSAEESLMMAGASGIIFVAGIDKVIQNLSDLELILSLKSANENGEVLPTEVFLLSGKKELSDSFSQPLHIVLLDNGRSAIMEHTELRRLFSCISCRACSFTSEMDSYSPSRFYDKRNNGPRSALTEGHLFHSSDKNHQVFAGPVYDIDNDVCPVNIPLTRMMEISRQQAVERLEVSKREKFNIYFWKNAVMKRSNMDKGGAMLKSFMFKQMFRKPWGNAREIISPAPSSFNQQWRERKNLR